MADFDITIIGGGINGTAIARDAAGRGLRVLLVEQGDLGAGTSSNTTKLIHGGLRYLEQGALRLVREGLREREIMLQTAPHIIRPARFVLPHHTGLRPAWQLRLGLFLYDVLGGSRILPGTRSIDLSKEDSGAPLQAQFKKAFEYSDCVVDDARLVLLNAVDAAGRGAEIRTRTQFIKAERQGKIWRIMLKTGSQQNDTVTSRTLVNASGPWIEMANKGLPVIAQQPRVRLVKGSHIVVKRLFTHEKIYIFQNADGRIVFAIPYQHAFTLVGTTELDFSGDPAGTSISDEETGYLCSLIGRYFRQPVTPKDVIWSFAGVRALCDNRQLYSKDLSRDYVVALDADRGEAPLLSIYGGKLTAARHVAEAALAQLQPYLNMAAAWTHHSPLPGGDFRWNELENLVQGTRARWSFLSAEHADRLVRAYGTRARLILGTAKRKEELGEDFGRDLTEAEVRYLMQHEWAQTAEDILWRRSKLGLHLSRAQQDKLADFLKRAGTQT